MPRRSLLSLAVVPVLLLGACGGGGGSSDSNQISDLIKDVGHHPANLCDKYADSALLAQAGGKAACDHAAKAADAKDPNVKIHSVTVNGKTATASITSNGEKTTIGFAKQGNDWKVVSTK